MHLDEEAGRWAVKCSGADEEHVRIKPDRLRVLASQSQPPIAGEIGFSVGSVYTSLSGWTGLRNEDSLGTVQLVLLGRWLQQRGYAFWSLGHCYSPEMDYKRQLGHRIYTRSEFRALLKQHRGPFDPMAVTTSNIANVQEAGSTFRPLRDGDTVDSITLLPESDS
jgi:hypothetical protein